MTFERITSPSHPLYAEAMALYGISFPAHEQRETPSQTAILTHPDYHFTAILDGSAFVGDMLYWETPDFRYIEHFCILPALRSQRYGSRALSMLPNDRPVILEIDPPVDEIAIRRKGFYERCGFTANPYPHVHPAYHKGVHGHDLLLMSRPDGLTDKQCRAFHTNSILKHGIEHSRFFVPAKLSEARRTGGTRERNDAKPGRKRCCANDMV